MPVLKPAVILVTAVLAHLAWAGETLLSDTVDSCEVDIRTYCNRTKPGHGRVLTCLFPNEEKISARCAMALNDASLRFERGTEQRAEVVNECAAGFEQNCPTSNTNRILKCMAIKVNEWDGISRGCYLAVEDVVLI